MIDQLTPVKKSVAKGAKVTVRNAHVVKMAAGPASLILCAKSRMDEMNENHSIHVTNADLKSFEANPMIKHCLHLTLSAKQLLMFYCAIESLEEFLALDLKQKYLIDHDEFPQDVFDFLGFDISRVR